MKHIKEYEEQDIRSLIDTLEGVGHGGLVGFMWIGTVGDSEHLGFLVVGNDEKDCVNLVIQSEIFKEYSRSPDWITLPKSSKFDGSFAELLERLFERGVISDAGHYPDLRARGGKRMLKSWFDPYTMNPKYCYDQAKEYFRNAEEVFSKEVPESKIWEP